MMSLASEQGRTQGLGPKTEETEKWRGICMFLPGDLEPGYSQEGGRPLPGSPFEGLALEGGQPCPQPEDSRDMGLDPRPAPLSWRDRKVEELRHVSTKSWTRWAYS